MAFIDGFVTAVPATGRDAYLRFTGKVWDKMKELGAISTMENWGVDVPHGKATDFHRAVQAKPDEAIVFSWITWPDRATRDTAMEKMMQPEVIDAMGGMPFDGSRMIFGGFETIFTSEETK